MRHLPAALILATAFAADVEPLLSRIGSYEYGQSREALVQFTRLVDESLASPGVLRQIESSLLKFLQSPATPAAKDFAFRELSRFATGASAPVLTKLAAQPETAGMARYALARIQGSKTGKPAPATRRDSNAARAQAIEIRRLSETRGPRITRQLMSRFPALNESGQVVLLAALADRGDRSAMPLFVNTAKTATGDVRAAALAGLGQLGDASVVGLLAEAGPRDAAALDALNALRGPGIDEAIVSALASASGQARIALIMAAGERGIGAAAGLLKDAVGDKDPVIHREALRALRHIAGPGDVPWLLDLLPKSREAPQTLASVLRRSEPAREQALQPLRAMLRESSPEVARAAIMALSDWETPVPLADLMTVARTQPNPALQVLALRGYLKLIALPSNRTAVESARMLNEAMPLARQAAERRSILSLLAAFPCKESLQAAEDAVKDPEVAKEAAASAERIRGLLRSQ